MPRIQTIDCQVSRYLSANWAIGLEFHVAAYGCSYGQILPT